MNEGYYKRDRHELLPPSLLVALPENADVALVYIILIKHHGSLSICFVRTAATESLTRAQEHTAKTL